MAASVEISVLKQAVSCLISLWYKQHFRNYCKCEEMEFKCSILFIIRYYCKVSKKYILRYLLTLLVTNKSFFMVILCTFMSYFFPKNAKDFRIGKQLQYTLWNTRKGKGNGLVTLLGNWIHTDVDFRSFFYTAGNVVPWLLISRCKGTMDIPICPISKNKQLVDSQLRVN